MSGRKLNDAEWLASPLLTGPGDGAQVLDELHKLVTKYVVLPSVSAEHAAVLWIATTHCLPAFDFAPRLVCKSAEKRCGKSRLLTIIEETCRDPLLTVNATVAAIFRSLDTEPPPTLLVDEADSIFGTKIKAELNEDLRGLLNAGYERNRPALRTVGPKHEPTRFPTFAMVALAGIGDLPDTIEDRAVVIRLRRRAPSEACARYRVKRDRPALNRMRDRLAAWAETVLDKLADADPDLPIEDRAADLWAPLVAVADAAGGHWPKRARTAAEVLSAENSDADADRSLGVRLLTDIRDVFATLPHVTFLPSAQLLRYLRDLDESPWRELDLTVQRLSRRLRPYGVRPRHNTAKTERGYHLADFADPFSRYLPPPTCPESSSRPDPPDSGASERTTWEPTDDSSRPGEPKSSGPSPANTGATDGRTTSDAYPADDEPEQLALWLLHEHLGTTPINEQETP